MQNKGNIEQTRSQNKYKPKAVRPSSRGNQNFEAARCYKARKDRSESDKIPTNLTRAPTNLTAVKTNLTAVKTNLTAVKTNPMRTPRIEHRDNKSEHIGPKAIRCKEVREDRLPQRNKHTPYRPHNIPHMVLCTKQGPDNA